MPKKYRPGEAMDALLNGTFDYSNVKTATQITEERAAQAKAERQAQINAERARYVQLDDVLTGNRDRLRIAKLQEVIDNPTTAPQEKESAAKSIARIKAKGGL